MEQLDNEKRTYKLPEVQIESVVDYNQDPPLVDPDLVWHGVIDDNYAVEVRRLDQVLAEQLQIHQEKYDPSYQGVLCIFNKKKGDKPLLYFEKVGLAYGAPLGPDAGDVATWQEKVVEFIDKTLPTARRG